VRYFCWNHVVASRHCYRSSRIRNDRGVSKSKGSPGPRSSISANPVFFSDCPLNLKAVDVEQLASVRCFRKEIERLGLISTYSSHTEFELKLRFAIFKTAIDLNNRRLEGKKSKVRKPEAAAAKTIEFSNAVEESNRDVETAVAAMNVITQSLIEFLVRIKMRTRELNEIQQSPDFSKSKLLDNINSAATDLEALSIRISEESPKQSRAFFRYFERMSDTIILSQDLPHDVATDSQLWQAHSLLDFLAEQMRSTMLKTVEFIDLIDA
jgi:predicted transcriptional regulator